MPSLFGSPGRAPAPGPSSGGWGEAIRNRGMVGAVQKGLRRRSLQSYLSFVRFEHTLFALPFAYGGMLLAAEGWPGWTTFAWVTLAMVGARTASMALNRVLDVEIDSRNPRTAGREIPAGHLGKVDGMVLVVAGFALLALAAWSLNRLTLALLPVAVFFLALYPLTKRWTWLCHYWLGITIGAAAPAGWIAVTGAFSGAAVALWLGVALWVAGFDIIYALLDIDFDRESGLQSAPVRFGEERALALSAWSHGAAVVSLAALLLLADRGVPFAASLVVVGCVLALEQRLARRRSASAALASFNSNLVVGLAILVGLVVDLVVAPAGP